LKGSFWGEGVGREVKVRAHHTELALVSTKNGHHLCIKNEQGLILVFLSVFVATGGEKGTGFVEEGGEGVGLCEGV
jgi:hypothetical protein